jgi:hypothetical protein
MKTPKAIVKNGRRLHGYICIFFHVKDDEYCISEVME